MHWKRAPTSLEHVPSLAASGLMGRYLRDPGFAVEFYGGHLSDALRLRERAETLLGRTYPRRELAEVLREQNRAWGMSRQTEERIAQLERGALCVFTGQQTGLFTGPLYAVYKALTAVRWAQHLNDLLGVPVVPMFWLAADDHDLAEIDHAAIFDRDGRLRTVRYATSAETGARRVSRLTFGQDITRWLDDALAVLPDGPGRGDVEKVLRNAYLPDRSWSDAFGCLAAQWFGGSGLILVSPDDARLKHLMASVFVREIRAPEASRRAVEERADAIRHAGYSPQVGLSGSGTLLFMDDDTGARRRIDREAGRLALAGTETRLTRREMERIVEQEPGRFSASALLRPVSADAVFPTIAHVMGAGEIAYMAQAHALYRLHDVPMPLLVPRARFTLIPEEIERLADEEHLSLDEAFQPFDRWIGLLAARATEREFGELIDACRAHLDAAYEQLDAAMAESLPGIRNAVTSARVKTQALMNRLAAKIGQEMRRKERRRAERIGRISDALYPFGSPQERVHSVVPYLARYGTGLLDALLDVVDVEQADHRALWLAD